MTWAKLDDKFHSHPKIRAALIRDPGAVALHVLAISFAADYETDGHVPDWFVTSVCTAARPRQRALAALVEGGLWRADGDGFVIHDYLDYNPSAEEVEHRRVRNSQRQQVFRDGDLRQRIRSRDNGHCRYCGVQVNWKDRRGPAGGTYDHVEPSGGNAPENLVVACRGCNSSKGGRTPAEAGMELIQLEASSDLDRS